MPFVCVFCSSEIFAIRFFCLFVPISPQESRQRKQSIMSEDSDLFPTTEKLVQQSDHQMRKPPFVNIIRQETTSTESKDTLTPVEISDDQTLVDDGSVENITEMNFEAVRLKALRRRSMSRRNSETYDMNRSQTSLNAAGAMSRRQMSLTQSEPDSGNEQGEQISWQSDKIFHHLLFSLDRFSYTCFDYLHFSYAFL